MHIFKQPIWSRFVMIARPYFASEARTKAIGSLVLLAGLLLAVNGLNFINSYIMRDFMTLVAEQQSQFLMYGLALAGVFGLASIGEAFQYYTEQHMGLTWRQWLTRRLLDRYLACRARHLLSDGKKIDNPDERISEDAKTFTTSTLSFTVLILNSLLALSLFLGVLWSITPWLVLTAVLYSAAGSLGTILLGRKLVPLNNQQLRKEGDFRYSLVQLRQNGDSENHNDTQAPSNDQLLDRFSKLVANFRQIISVTRNVGMFTREFSYLIQIIPALVVAPFYIHKQVQFGAIPQAAMAFAQVVGAFSLIVTKFQEASTLAAVINRLSSMLEAMESACATSGSSDKASAREADGQEASAKRA
ncbi:MAG TPA: SbmA/BacA-like family transporter [Gemmataceae bacterium]|jgi:putative ATP-binding cassette transporter